MSNNFVIKRGFFEKYNLPCATQQLLHCCLFKRDFQVGPSSLLESATDIQLQKWKNFSDGAKDWKREANELLA